MLPALDSPTPHLICAAPRTELVEQRKLGAVTPTAAATEEPPATETDQRIRAALISVLRAIIAPFNVEHFDQLDAATGDGDCGRSVARGASAALETLETTTTMECRRLSTNGALNKVMLVELGSVIADSTGGSAGPLLGALVSLGGAAAAAENGSRALLAAIEAGTRAVMQIGGAAVGERTMVDVLSALCEYGKKMPQDRDDMPLAGVLTELIEVARSVCGKSGAGNEGDERPFSLSW